MQNIIPSHNEGECQDCERIFIAPSLQTDVSNGDNPNQEMEKYIHDILQDDDPETIDHKDE